MRFSLYRKLLLLFCLVILIALSSSVLLRNFVINDFKSFGEGRVLDRLYQIQAVLEGRYERNLGWRPDQIGDDFIWAWLSGIELRLYDADNNLVLDTGQALANLPPAMLQRIRAIYSRPPLPDNSSEFQSYPLFLKSEEIGRLEALLPRPVHEDFFIHSSNRFLAYSVIGLGLIAALLSFLSARRLSRPLHELTLAAEQLAAGITARRVQVTDNDEIGRLSLTFNRMADSLEAQERLRKQLVSNAAHELRTPLMVIRGELEGMMDGLLPTTSAAMQSLHDETVRLANILDGVDELTRAQAASQNLKLKKTQLVPFFRQALARFESQAAARKVTIAVNGDDELYLLIDPDIFTRIIINLASNSLRAMPDGGQLDINVTQTTSCRAHVNITDTGAGIDPEQLPHIFERFHKGKNGGLGLGLAIVKELVEAHDGTIKVFSELGNGANFMIELPVRQSVVY